MRYRLTLLTLVTALSSCLNPQGAGYEDPRVNADSAQAGPTATTASVQSTTLDLTATLESRYHLKGGTDPFHVLLNVRAAQDTSHRERLPLNLAVVIDRSGSMADAGKLEYVKRAVELIIDNLAPTDRLSLVAYDSEVQVLRSAEDGELDREALKRRVWSLSPGSSTNLSGGLLEGYAQAARNKAPSFVHRVLLLSDGLANQGVTDVNALEAIVKGKFQELGIALSTFGVGAEFNEDMMTSLAEQGRGNYWFIDAADKIPGMFAQEMNGLLNVVAQNTRITVAYPADVVEVADVYGHTYSAAKGVLTIELNDLVSGAERDVLVAFRPRVAVNAPLGLACALTYDDVLRTKARAQEDQALKLEPTSDAQVVAEALDPEVARRKVQFIANRNLEEAMREADKGNYAGAIGLVNANAGYMSYSFSAVAADSSQNALFELNDAYLKQLGTMQQMGETERKMLQKGTKSEAYWNRKGK